MVRLRQTNSSGTILTEYSHNGVGRLAIVDYPQPDVNLDYFQGTTGTYAGFDRFGRVKDRRERAHAAGCGAFPPGRRYGAGQWLDVGQERRVRVRLAVEGRGVEDD